MIGEHQPLYQELQRRMGPGGDLSPGPRDTVSHHFRDGLWTREREQSHRAILEQFKDQYRDRPRDGQAVLLTAGAPGAGKGGAQAGLARWQGQDTGLGRELARAHGVNLDLYVVLDPDQFKVALFEHGGLPRLDARAMALPFGRELAPSEMAWLIHRESAFLQDQFEVWARREGYNLLYDATLKNLDKNIRLLTDLQHQGYDQRVVLSVEVPLEQCLAQNAARWESGRIRYEQGLDAYGGRMAPEGMIRDLYAHSTSGRGYSIGRENAERLADKGLVTALITSDRGDFGPGAAARSPLVQARTFQQGDSVIRISAAGRLRSGRGDAAPRPTAVPGTAAPATPRTPRRPPGPGRSL